jgi:UDP-3-O-[3-hydroxymyristoyl] N-acetylglucosamine deacetylase
MHEMQPSTPAFDDAEAGDGGPWIDSEHEHGDRCTLAIPAQMFNLPAKTIGQGAHITGIGLHSGTPSSVRFEPAPAGHGVVFVAAGQRVPARWDLADGPAGSTRLPGVATPEHLLAAVMGLGITDLLVHLEGSEVPHLDGSALPWVQALGETVCTGTVRARTVDSPVVVEAFGGIARVLPCDRLELAVRVDFGAGLRGDVELVVTPESFVRELCWARTFVPHASLPEQVASGRGRGAGPGDVVVWGPRGPLVPVRSADEPVRHKALDALGDLALASPLFARFEVERGSHALHLAALRAWLG